METATSLSLIIEREPSVRRFMPQFAAMHLELQDPKEVHSRVLTLEKESRLQIEFRQLAELNRQATNRLETIDRPSENQKVGQREIVMVSYYLLGTQVIQGYEAMDIDVGFKHHHRNLPGLIQGPTTIEEAIKDWSGVSKKFCHQDLKVVAIIEVTEKWRLGEAPSFSIYVYRSDDLPTPELTS